jgi:hypothetical protein
MPSPTRIRSRSLIAGVVMPPAARSAGKSFPNGCGTRLLEPGHALDPAAMRTTEFAPALLPAQQEAADFPSSSLGYGPAEQALPWKRSRFSGRDFIPQPDGTLRCPAGQLLFAQERRVIRRWEPARGVCGQHPQLPSLSPAGAVSMAWQSHRQASPGECEARIHSSSALLPSSGGIGAGGFIDGRACS